MLEDLSSAALGAACARDGSNVTNATTSSEGNTATRQQFTIVCKRRTLASEVSAWHVPLLGCLYNIAILDH
jgi:hypothetical protein